VQARKLRNKMNILEKVPRTIFAPLNGERTWELLDRETHFLLNRKDRVLRLIEEILVTEPPREMQIKLEELRVLILTNGCTPVEVMKNAVLLIEGIKLILEKKNDEMSVMVASSKREYEDAKNRLAAAKSGMVLDRGSSVVEKAIAELAGMGGRGKNSRKCVECF
jgi:hypothetical protein